MSNRLGVDSCPGGAEYGHGANLATVHGFGCCDDWASGKTASTSRAEGFREAAARWGETWPRPDKELEPGG